MDIKVSGIDPGKTSCSLAGPDEAGAVVIRERFRRHRRLNFLHDLPPCIVAMEACGGAHHIGRLCRQHGHEPRLMSPLHVNRWGRMKPSAYCDRIVNVMEKLMKFMLLTRDSADYHVDLYSERRESADQLSARINQSAI